MTNGTTKEYTYRRKGKPVASVYKMADGSGAYETASVGYHETATAHEAFTFIDGWLGKMDGCRGFYNDDPR